MSASDVFRLPVGGSSIVVNCANQSALLDGVREKLRAGIGFAIATVNLDHLVKLKAQERFRLAYSEQDFVVADGNPIVWLSHLAGNPVSLVPGSDLVMPLMELAAEQGVPVALFGATEEALARSSRELEARIPGLAIVARIAPSERFDPTGAEADGAIERLHRSGARLTFLALGAPKQEVFAARAKAMLPGMGFASVGAGLDFIAGSQTRAPLWIRRIAMEWLWRMLSQPRRLARRYLHCAILLPRLAAGVLSSRAAL